MEGRYHNYQSILNDTKEYNRSLADERRSRLPFIDSQTGIAQTDCGLWRSSEHRRHVHQSGITATLYKYPAQRWSKRRREYLLRATPSSVTSSELIANCSKHVEYPSGATECAIASLSRTPGLQYQQVATPSSQSCSFSRSTDGHMTTIAPPPRADSTGSHSNVDSDSRDQSSATSQSVDSPRGQIEDEHSCHNLDTHFSASSKDENKSGSDNGSIVNIANDNQPYNGLIMANLIEGMSSAKPIKECTRQELKEKTREAIRWQSKISKKKNAGQSLIKHNSSSTRNCHKITEDCLRTKLNQNGCVMSTKLSTGDCILDDAIPEAIMSTGDRPYICSICDQTYKTRPGLSYHFIHTHNKTLPRTLPTKVDPMYYKKEHRHESTRSNKLSTNVKILPKKNPFCDFCHGTEDKNRRTRLPEELISCSGCGSSGHPSCLRFSDNIRMSVRKYDWQCIECKTCSTCNTADNEDQLLFCDDCDRSYHTYCLRPPLLELPEGNWSCQLCLAEYYEKSE